MLQKNPDAGHGDSRICEALFETWRGVEQMRVARVAQEAIDDLDEAEFELVLYYLSCSRKAGKKVPLAACEFGAHVLKAYNLVYERNRSKTFRAFLDMYLMAPVCAQAAFLAHLEMC